MLVGPLPGLPATSPLHDRSPDPGLFGPGSVTWRLAGEPLLLLGGGRALLMQVAHPLIAAAVVEHSDFARDPYGRLLRTLEWAAAISMGTTAEARAACAAVTARHRQVVGDGYAAGDPVLARWVHATLVESMLETELRLGGRIAAADGDRFVREWNAAAALMDLPESTHFRGAAHLHAYIDASLASGALRPSAASMEIARAVLHPPLPSPLLAPLDHVLRLTTISLLPTSLRRGYGIDWSRREDLVARAAWRSLAAARRVAPRRLRLTAVGRQAASRIAGGTPS